jgi:hypothetical protein
MRSCFARLADEYVKLGNTEKAIQVLDKCMVLMPYETVPYDFFMLQIISAYDHAGAIEKATRYAAQFKNILQKELEYYQSLHANMAKSVDYELKYAVYMLQELAALRQPLI